MLREPGSVYEREDNMTVVPEKLSISSRFAVDCVAVVPEAFVLIISATRVLIRDLFILHKLLKLSRSPLIAPILFSTPLY